MVDDASRNVFQADEMDAALVHVHVALVPDLNGIGKLADLQSRIWRNLPPEAAARIAWVHPDAFCVVLGYLGHVRRSLIPCVQDLCRRLLPTDPPNLQAQRIVTSHDAQGTPRVLGIGFSVDSYLLEFQSRLAAELGAFGLEVLPREFTPRVTLARLPADLVPVMAVLENFATSFPMTLRFPEVDLSARGEKNQKIQLDRILLMRPRHEGLFDRLHGCCMEQSNRFAFPQMMDCPRKHLPSFDLPCFETGQSPAHPVEEPGSTEGQVDSGMIHEGTADLLRIGRNRPLGRAALLDAAHTDETHDLDAPPPPPPSTGRPPQREQPRDNRPPQRQGGGMQTSHRDPRAPQRDSSQNNRPPREPRDNRPPREPRPPRDPQREQPRDGGQNNRPPREPRDNRPPREPRPPRDPQREQPRDGQNKSEPRPGDGQRPPQDRARQPEERKTTPESGEE